MKSSVDHPVSDMRHSISVVIPTYNRAHQVLRAVESVLGQDFRDYELIVVDDGSTDDTREVLVPLRGRLQYVCQENQGPGAARNLGVQHAGGRWVAFLDSDDEWLPNKLGTQLEWAEAMRADVCFHDVFSGERREEPRGVRRWDGTELQGGGLSPMDPRECMKSFELLVEAAHLFLTTSLLVRRDAFLAVGGMRRDLLTNQDIDLYLRLFPRYRVGCMAEPLAVYSPGANRACEVASAKARNEGEKGRSRVQRDRLRGYARAYRDRIENGDRGRAEIVRRGMVRAIHNLAGLTRRQKGGRGALKAYSCYALMRALPFCSPLRILGWHALIEKDGGGSVSGVEWPGRRSRALEGAAMKD